MKPILIVCAAAANALKASAAASASFSVRIYPPRKVADSNRSIDYECPHGHDLERGGRPRDGAHLRAVVPGRRGDCHRPERALAAHGGEFLRRPVLLPRGAVVRRWRVAL